MLLRSSRPYNNILPLEHYNGGEDSLHHVIIAVRKTNTVHLVVRNSSHRYESDVNLFYHSLILIWEESLLNEFLGIFHGWKRIVGVVSCVHLTIVDFIKTWSCTNLSICRGISLYPKQTLSSSTTVNVWPWDYSLYSFLSLREKITRFFIFCHVSFEVTSVPALSSRICLQCPHF